ncbi:MAG: hypothetical protein AAF289_00715 [Cyanobacteria bacterium P01_A01_bin.135]
MRTQTQILVQCCRILALASLSTVSLLAIAPAGQAAFWSDFFDNDPPDEPTPHGSRGGYFCAIAPNSSGIVQSDRPQLLWQGAADQVEIYAVGVVEPVWTGELSEDDILQRSQFVFEAPLLNEPIYAISPDIQLEPDQEYLFYANANSSSFGPTKFRAASVTVPSSSEGSTPEAESLAQADAFAQAELWPEFWREVLSIQQPSTELVTVLEAQLLRICPQAQ